MARNHYKRRRRRGRFAFLLKLLCLALIIAAMIAALTMFFKAETIVVTGNERYTNAQILEASGLETGDNLFLMNKYAVAQTIFSKLPYVESASIDRKLPDTLLIGVKECTAAASVPGEKGSFLISDAGKVLEESKSLPEGCVRVSGLTLLAPEISKPASAGSEADYKLTALLTLLQSAGEKRLRANILSVELGDDTCLQFAYTERFTVKMPWNADIAYKLESLATVVDYLELNETGTINLMTEGKASFIPD